MQRYKPAILVFAFYFGALALLVFPLACLSLYFLIPEKLLPLYGGWLLFTAALAALIAWSVMPRRHRIELNGIPLNPRDQPDLDEFLREVAERTAQPLPSLVLLTAEARASAGFYTGWAGFGGARVLTLGLPYFATFTRAELAALVAHELGHFHRGSLFAWSWILETQRAMSRLARFLERRAPRLLPAFEFVLKPFIKATMDIRRRQELDADRFAATHYGAATVQRALEKNHHLELDFHIYFQSEVVPALHAGFALPLLDGFRQFLSQLRQGAVIRLHHATPTDPFLAAPRTAELPAGEEDFLQTHPNLDDRISAMSRDASGLTPEEPSRRAAELLLNLPRLELRLLEFEAQRRRLPVPRKILWPQAGDRVYLAQWDLLASQFKDLLAPYTVAQLPAAVDRAAALGVHREPGAGTHVATELGLELLTAALCSTLSFHGWTLTYKSPGMARAFRKGAHTVDPFHAIERLAFKQIAFFEWEDECEALGIGGLPLTSASPAGSPPPSAYSPPLPSR